MEDCSCNTNFTSKIGSNYLCYFCGIPTIKKDAIADLLPPSIEEKLDLPSIDPDKECSVCTMKVCGCLEKEWSRYRINYGWDPSNQGFGDKPHSLHTIGDAQKLWPGLSIGSKNTHNTYYLRHTRMQ